MYREIANYHGNFGDPICGTFSFDPWKMLDSDMLTEFERKGVLVAMLVDLMAAIDNATHEDAVASALGDKARRVLNKKSAEDFPLVTKALVDFFQSEQAFSDALTPIYREWIVPAIQS